MKRIRGITLIVACTLLVVGVFVLGTLRVIHAHTLESSAHSSIGGDFTFCFPASQMHDRVANYRSTFVNQYLIPQNPYQVFAAMTQARMEPASFNDEVTLGKRGPFVFVNPNTMTNDASSLGICRPGDVCSSATFPIDLGGNEYLVKADFAPRMDVTLQNGGALSFDFGSGIPIHISNPGTTPIPVVRPDMFFRSVRLSDGFLEEVLTSPATATDTALSITIHLDLIGTCANTSNAVKKEKH